MNKKELLDKAFNEAIVEVNVNSMEGIGIMEEIITTSMNAFATREKVEFKPEEIRATIIAGLETIKQAGEDFTLQTRIMF